MKKIAVALLCLYVCWGSTYLAIRVALESFPPLSMSGVRFLTAGALLCVWRGASGDLRNLRHWISAAIVGTLLLVGGTGVIAWAEQTVTSGQAALSVATVPVWMALFQWLGPERRRPAAVAVAGMVTGSLGVACLMGSPGQWTAGSVLVFLAALSWTAGSLLSRQLVKPTDTVLFSGMTMVCAGVVMTGLGFLAQEGMRGPVTPTALGAWVYLVVVGSLLGLTAYTWLLENASPTLVATYTYVNPLVAVLLARLAGESLPERLGLATALVVGGVALIAMQGVRFSPRVFCSHLPLVGRLNGECAGL